MTNEHDMPTGPLTSTDDPRVLAYLLGELDAADVAHVESFLADTPDAAAELDELRAVLGILETEIATDAASPKLHEGQREQIAAAASAPVAAPPRASSGVWFRAAATIVATAGLAWLAVQMLDEAPHASVPVETAVVKGDPSPLHRIRAMREAEDAGDERALLDALGYSKEPLQTLGYTDEGLGDERIAQLEALGYTDGESDLALLSMLESAGYIDTAVDQLSVNARGEAVAPYVPPAAATDPAGETFGTVSESDEARQAAKDAARSFGRAGGAGKLGRRSDRTQAGVEIVGEAAADTVVDAAFDSTAVNDVIGVGGAAGGAATPAPAPATAPDPSAPASGGAGLPVTGTGGRATRGQSGRKATTGGAANSSASGSLGVLSGRGRKAAAGAAPPAPREEALRLVELGYVTNDPPADADDARVAFDFAPRRDTRAEGFAPVHENPFKSPRDPQHALSTFGLDVDTASYAYMRRMLNEGKLPPPSSIRLEELINTFDYDDGWAQEILAEGEAPIALRVDGGWCPWSGDHRLVRLSMQAFEAPADERPAANLVFLIDVSGSMKPDDRLPLLKSAMRLLVGTLRADDRVAIVTYNDNAGVTLESTTCDRKDVILSALDSLRAGGSTNGEAGLRNAYKVASQHFVEGGVNRVILASDGDFNVGAQSRDELFGLITQQATSGVFLTVLGFGTGNLKDSNLELLADRGNGHYAYIDTLAEGEKVLVEEAGSTLQTVAKDVKIQVEFNPAKVNAYRLLGYENRALAARDFNDDRKDAGDVGAGHTVTALYEVIPAGIEWEPQVDDLKYQKPAQPEPDVELSDSPEMLTAKLRYKLPDADTSELIVVPYEDRPLMINAGPGQYFDGMDLDDDMRFASAVAAFGMLMRGSQYAGAADFDMVIDMAQRSRGDDPRGYRAEFVRLATIAKGLIGD